MKINMDIRKVKIEIGKTNNDQSFYYSPHEMSNLLIVGKNGSSQTSLIKKIIKGLQKEISSEYIKFAVFDSKNEDYKFTSNSPYTYLYHSSKNDEYVDLLKHTIGLLQNRKKLFKELSVRNIEEYNQKNKEKLEYVFLIADDFGELPQNAIDLLVDLSTNGRSLGIYTILATSNTKIDKNRVLTGIVKATFLERICFKVDNRLESKLVIDEYGAEELSSDEILLSTALSEKALKLNII